MPSPSPKDQSALRRASLLLAIPTILIVSPLVGLFLGMQVDRWLHSGRIGAFIGTMLGFVAGGRETWMIYRRYQQMEDEDAGRR